MAGPASSYTDVITCAPAEQLLRKAEVIAIGVSRPNPRLSIKATEPGTPSEPKGALPSSAQTAEPQKTRSVLSDARLGLEVAATAERWTPGASCLKNLRLKPMHGRHYRGSRSLQEPHRTSLLAMASSPRANVWEGQVYTYTPLIPQL